MEILISSAAAARVGWGKLVKWNGCIIHLTRKLFNIIHYRRSLVLELQTTRELLASSLKKVQDLELESGKVPALQSRIHELERNLGKPNTTRYVTTATDE